jgi:Fur family transcriptional regulator, peroxide stress response regulator
MEALQSELYILESMDMTISPDEIVQILKDRGLRVTPQRFAVYRNLLDREDHPTVDKLLLDLNAQGPVSSQATVYSALQALQNVGLIREVRIEAGIVAGIGRYDANVHPHHHFCCNNCGSIADLPWQTFAELDLQKIKPELQAQTYEVVVRGLCNECQPEF